MNKHLKSLKHNLAFLKDDHKTKFHHKKTKLGPCLICEIRPDKHRVIAWRFTLYERNQYLGASLSFIQSARKNKKNETYHLSEVLKGRTIPGISSSSLNALKKSYGFSENDGTIVADTSPEDMVAVYTDVVRDDIDEVIRQADHVLE